MDQLLAAPVCSVSWERKDSQAGSAGKLLFSLVSNYLEFIYLFIYSDR